MAMSYMISRASSAVISRAIRPIASSKTMSAASINNAIFSGTSNFCTDSKKKLLNEKILTALKSEIESEEKHQHMHVLPVPPPDFPFTMEHGYFCGNERITLKRDFNGEKIEFVANHFYDHEEDFDGDVITWEHSRSNASPVSSVDVEARISKPSGRMISLHVSADTDDVSPHEISVGEESAPEELLGSYSLSVDEEDEMANGMKEYVEIRGLKKSNVPFLVKYMAAKSRRRHLLVLQKMMDFIQQCK
ncbi:PREDICTED: uncharacterized protein At2g39795, mitochondrial-like [Erythranthe guttata]|uniref:uncharacterized protein At2g39795, mitochondrial-like n=1 Tax=Erythranthe guttata TaxID=4155 RepID=UPI00064DE248|nr:PREDICTED: uncharacterized protein At2g39795, mitochondrial-like [Erythranthe guttata]|eukprot:XP_012831829.1 PREDICTED: uncharacterized protein At2g39795, mitochondrial-like [Erythranthe guttata]